jgi:hypothetical protein
MATTKPRAAKPPASDIRPSGMCGYRIDRGATKGERLGPDECAFTTYALVQGPAIGLSEPTVAFWGPGQVITQKFGSATPTYFFVGGVVFKNC